MQSDNEKTKQKSVPYNLYIVVGIYLTMLIYPILLESFFTRFFEHNNIYLFSIILFFIAIIFSHRGIKKKEPINAGGAMLFGIIITLFSLYEIFALALGE